MNSSVLAIANKIGSALVSYLYIYLMSACLYDGHLGAFFYAFSVYTVLVQVSKAGIDMVIIKALSGCSRNPKEVVLQNVIYVITFSSLLGLIYFLVYEFSFIEALNVIDDKLAVAAAIVAIVVSSVSQVFAAFYQNERNTTYQYWSMNTGFAGIGCVMIVFYFWYSGVIEFSGVAYIMLASSVVALILSVYFFLDSTQNYQMPKGNIGMRSVHRTLVENLPFVAVAFLTIMLQWLIYLLAGIQGSGMIMAEYSLALRLSFLTSFVFLALTSLISPVISVALRDDNSTQIVTEYLKYHSLSVIPATVVLVVFAVAGSHIMKIFGIESDGVTLWLCTLAWWIRVVAGPVGTVMVLDGKSLISIYTLCLAVVFTVISYYVLGSFDYMYSFGVSAVVGALVLSVLNSYYVYTRYGFLGWSPSYMWLSTRLLTLRVFKGKR